MNLCIERQILKRTAKLDCKTQIKNNYIRERKGINKLLKNPPFQHSNAKELGCSKEEEKEKERIHVNTPEPCSKLLRSLENIKAPHSNRSRDGN